MFMTSESMGICISSLPLSSKGGRNRVGTAPLVGLNSDWCPWCQLEALSGDLHTLFFFFFWRDTDNLAD